MSNRNRWFLHVLAGCVIGFGSMTTFYIWYLGQVGNLYELRIACGTIEAQIYNRERLRGECIPNAYKSILNDFVDQKNTPNFEKFISDLEADEMREVVAILEANIDSDIWALRKFESPFLEEYFGGLLMLQRHSFEDIFVSAGDIDKVFSGNGPKQLHEARQTVLEIRD